MGLDPWLADAIVELDDCFAAGRYADATETLGSLLESAPRTYAQFVADHLSAFGG